VVYVHLLGRNAANTHDWALRASLVMSCPDLSRKAPVVFRAI